MAVSLPPGTTAPRGLPPVSQFQWPLIPSRDLFELRYGRALVETLRRPGSIPVYGTNGRCGSHDKALFKGPGVILGRKGQGPLGVEWSEGDYWVIDTAYSLIPLSPNIDLKYAYFLIKYIGLNHLKDGTSNPTLSRDSFGAQALPLPPLDVQRAIAHILGTLDDKIELNRRMNETLEAMARALFESWFIDFDPVRAKAEGRDPSLPKSLANLFPDSFEDSELGEIPKGWEVRSLYETAEFINGAAFKSEDFCDSSLGLPIVKIAELKDGIGAQTKFSDRVLDPKQLIDTGELLYSWSGSPDTSLDAFLWTKGRGLLNQHIFKVITPTIAEKRFVYYLLKFLKPTLVEIARNKQTTGLGHVTVADMKRLYVCSPAQNVLAAFDNQVAPLFNRAFKITVQNQTLVALRDALLPKLISGELRVTDAEKFIGGRV